MRETSVLSVGAIRNDLIFSGRKLVKIFFLEKSDGGLNIYGNFSKIVIKGIYNARGIIDCCIIN